MRALVLVAFLLAVKDQSHRPIELKISPTVCLAPCSIRAIVRIEPHELNRWYVLQIDGAMFVSGMRQLEGADSPPTQDAVWFKGLPPGEYTVTAVVYRTAEAGRVTQTVLVSGS